MSITSRDQTRGSDSPTTGRAPLIVVVNDDAAFLDMMCELLTEEGYRAITLFGIETRRTYEVIRSEKPDLVILDILLNNPDYSWTILDLIRLSPLTTHIPVLVCSADARALREKEGLLRDKNCDTLEKPFTLEDLLAKINKAVGPPLASR